MVLWIAALLLPTAAGADGLIVVSDPPHAPPGHFSFAPLEVAWHRVTVDINDLVAVTNVDQEFFNPGDSRLEGTYVFPLPPGAHIDRFSMDVNGVMMDAELLPADKARALYEEIVRKARDPALLEYAGQGAFKVRIFPIEPHSRKRIRLFYTQLLSSDSGLSGYTYPLNTEKFSAAPLREVSVTVRLDGKDALRSLYCPSHDVEIRRDGDRRATVGWEARDARPDTDFQIVFSRGQGGVSMDLIAHRVPGEDGTFLLLLSPGAVAEGAAAQPKDICFVLDTSGSMAGRKLDQAKKALRFCLANLNAGDRFEIVRFSTEAEPLFGGLTPAARDSLDRAERFLDALQPIGGTAIADALGRALALRGNGAERPFFVVFLTDGLPTVGETREDPIVERIGKTAGNARIFAFGIGDDVNTHLLDRIADGTRGLSRYVLPGEDIELKVGSFYAKIKDPALTGLSLGFPKSGIRVKELYPAALPDLFAGDMLAVFGRYEGSGTATAMVTGFVNGKPREFTASVRFPESSPDNSYVPVLWATRRVGWLLDEIRRHGESAELRDEVVRLARRYGIVTPYTAYLILEDEARRNVPVTLRSYRELAEDADALASVRDRMGSMEKEAASEAGRSGRSAVDNAMAVQDLKRSTNQAQSRQAGGLAKAAPAPAGAGGGKGYRIEQAASYARQVQLAGGRAFYRNGDVWTDSTAQGRTGLRRVAVRFNGPAYFTLLAEHPEAAAWLALGNAVDLVIGDVLIVIRDE